MLLGDNASGKSTILKSIAIGLSSESEAISLINFDGGNFISRGKVEGKITLRLLETYSNENYDIETIISKQENSNDEFIFRNIDGQIELSEIFICGYGTNRCSQATESFSEYNKTSALKSLFSNEARLQNPELVLLRKNERIRAKIEDHLLKILLLDPEQYGLKYSKNGLEVTGPWGSESFNSLSDGYRVTTQWVLDFISWGIYADKFVYSSKFNGILLLDEIELQLHPQWQQVIVSRIREQFPDIQIISTTHTPLIASSIANLENSRLVRLKLTDKGIC